MAQKRMFDRSIIETDNFLNISLNAKALYFLLGMEADDEGFISPKRVMRLYGGETGDLKNLIDTGLVIPFKSGVVVITDWNQNNWLDNRRIKPTQYQLEKKMLTINEQKKYLLSVGLASAKREERSIEEYRGEEKSIEQSKKEIVKNYSLQDKNLTDLLYKLIKQNYPFLKEKDYSKDYSEMNKLNRIDKWDYKQIEYIINWSQRDDFWKQNIRSVSKLRKQFEALAVKAKENNNQVIKI